MSDQSQIERTTHEPRLASYHHAERRGRTADVAAVLGNFRSLPLPRHKEIEPRPVAAAVAATEMRQTSSDPVVTRLVEVLEVAERDSQRDTEVFADALRFAIRARLLELKTGDSPHTGEHVRLPTERRALQKWRLRRVVDYVDQHLAGRITLADLASAAGLSRMHFAAQFRAATGFRPHEYLLRRRVQLAEELLRHSTLTIVEIALTVGFQTQAHFTTVFKRFAGNTPCQWRHAQRAEMLK